jgi:cytochrome c551/c552
MPTARARALVNQYCAGCHNDKIKSGGFSWASIDLAHPDQSGPDAERVIRKLRAGMMPPPGIPRPDSATIKALAASIENDIDRVAATHPRPGKPALHRLNRTEYANSIRDLLAVEVDISKILPPDNMSFGFDNMADVLDVSPALMEGYIRAASKVSREAVGDLEATPVTASYTLPRTLTQTRHVDGTPFGTRGGLAVTYDFPADGEYVFKVGFYYAQQGALYGRNQGKGQQIEIAVNGEKVALLDIDPGITESTENLKTPPIKVKAGPQRVSASFPQSFDGPIDDEYHMLEQTLVDVNTGSFPGITTVPHLHRLDVTGPMHVSGISDTPSRKKIFTCRPAAVQDGIPCARQIISRLGRQAWRRPLTDSDVEALLSFYQRGKNNGDFETGIRGALQAMIASPNFVFRFEEVPAGIAPGQNYSISDLELASRLSYFLWSSGPDEELIAIAGQNKLHDRAVLQQQVRRMLADWKSEALTKNFASQWLHLQNLKGVTADLYIYQNFDTSLTDSMRRGTELFFDSVVREDRNILDLLTANYTFVDERLAKHYGIPDVLGPRFRRVTWTDPNRFGLLGQGSILMLTSNTNRTSPVQRGKYVMEVLLGTPPPAPPANVPPLKESGDDDKPVSVRERMEQHRAQEPCASCHKLMDPIGMALENFDAVGVWRNHDGGYPIDASGQMFDGSKLDGPVSLRQAILSHSDAFIGTFTENLLAYGIGRVPASSDMPVVRAIEREAAQKNNRFVSFIMGVVTSAPFQLRNAPEKPAGDTSIAAHR